MTTLNGMILPSEFVHTLCPRCQRVTRTVNTVNQEIFNYGPMLCRPYCSTRCEEQGKKK